MIWSRSKSFKIFAYALNILFDFCKMQMLKSPKSIVSQSDLKFVKISSKLFRKSFCLGGLYSVSLIIGFVLGNKSSTKRISSLSV